MKTICPFVGTSLCTWMVFSAVAADHAHMSLSIGYGQYESLTQSGQDQPFYLLPRWAWYQDDFYIENLDLGYNLYESPQFSVDLTTKQSYDALLFRGGKTKESLIRGLSFADVPIPWNEDLEELVQPRKRHFSYLAGVTVFYRQQTMQLSSGWHQDISGTHSGFEWNTEWTQTRLWQHFSLQGTVALRYLDADYSNYYFGLSLPEISYAYQHQPGAVWLPSIRLESSYQLSPNSRLQLSLKREWLSPHFEQSYLFSDRSHDIWFVGYSRSW